MSEGGEGEGRAAEPSEGEPSEGEMRRLRAERNHLRDRVELLEARPERRRRLRLVLAPILAALAVLVFTLTVPAAWGSRTVLDTDRYVATVGPLAADQAVQRSIATKLTDQVFAALDVEDVLADALAQLGDRAALLAAPLTNAMRGFVQDRVEALVASDAFQTFWVEANRFVHTQVLAILEGDEGSVSVREGRVLLNLLPLVNLALVQIQTVASDLVGRDVTLPTIEPDDVPEDSVSELEQALGVDLPESYGQIVVYDADDLAALQQALYLFQRGLVLLLLLIPILAGLALWTSTRRRRTLIQMTSGAAVGLVLVRRLTIVLRDDLFENVDLERFPAVRVLTDELTESLFRYTGVLLAIVLLTLLIALVTGPYPWAVGFRAWVRDTGQGLASAFGGGAVRETGRVRWVRAHRDPLMLGGAVLAVALLFLVDLSLWGFLVVCVALLLFEIAVARLGREPEPEVPGPA